MAVRAMQGRIDCDRETLRALWRTHRTFNERLPSVLSVLFKMRRGKLGRNAAERQLYRDVGRFIVSCPAQNADYLMNAVSLKGWKPGSAKKYKIKSVDGDGRAIEVLGETWADEAAKLSAQGKLLFDKDELSGDLPGCMRQMLNREAVAIISGHDELVALWEKAHAEWQKKKAEWEANAENQKYLKLRPCFERFEQQAGGKAFKRRGRWHLYLDWLRKNPDLAAWRGGEGVVHELSAAAKEKVRKAKPWKQRSVEAAEFWEVNPELAALDRLHGYYEREFVRRRKTKRNPDGFDHRPTFTMPHAVNHPRWFVFNAPQTNPSGYADLVLPNKPGAFGSVKLCLLTGDRNGEPEYPSSWVTVRFRSDPRLSRFRRVKVNKTVNRGKDKGQIKSKDGYEFLDPYLMQWRGAEISGVKLMLRDIQLTPGGSLKSAVPYLVFTVSIDDLPLTDRAKKIEWSETGQLTKSGRPRKNRKLPDGLTACAVDLGLRHVGFATLAVCEDGKPRVLRSRNIWLDGANGGPDLAHIGRHKRDIRRLRRLRGKPVKGEESHVELQDHITNMGEDRFKKAARAILNFAWNVDQGCNKKTGEAFPRADVIVLEKLEGFIPDAEKERGINKALVAWNRGQLVNRLKEMAVDSGYKGRVFEVHPAGTSQVCCRCGALGRRYSIDSDNPEKQSDIRFGWVEKLFACPACGYRANSDHNASVNLHRKFALGDSAVKAFFDWKSEAEKKRKERLAEIDRQLADSLRKLHRLPPYSLATPF